MTMPMPNWATEEARDANTEQMEQQKAEGVKAIALTPITNFSTLFAEWMAKEDDILVHLFPRAGEGDVWHSGSYDRHGDYEPARREEKSSFEFPEDMRELISRAADKAWLGDVAVDYIPELVAYAVQFQDVRTTAAVVGPGKFVDTFCGALDKEIG
jgi:hypothetical protein